MEQQFCWFENYGKVLSFLCEKNTGLCNRTGKSFGELIHHLIVGGDETCMMADAGGYLKIVGEAWKNKHKNNVSD